MDGTKEGSNAVEELLLPDEVAIIGDGDNDLGPSQSFDAAPLRAQRKTSVATAARVEQLSAIEEALRAPHSCEDDATALEASWRSIMIRPFFFSLVFVSLSFQPEKLVKKSNLPVLSLFHFSFYSDVRIKKSSESM